MTSPPPPPPSRRERSPSPRRRRESGDREQPRARGSDDSTAGSSSRHRPSITNGMLSIASILAGARRSLGMPFSRPGPGSFGGATTYPSAEKGESGARLYDGRLRSSFAYVTGDVLADGSDMESLLCDEAVSSEDDTGSSGLGGEGVAGDPFATVGGFLGEGEHGGQEDGSGGSEGGGGGYLWETTPNGEDGDGGGSPPPPDSEGSDSPSDSSTPDIGYDAKKCHLTEEAARMELGKKVARRFENGIIFLGDVVDVVFVAASVDEPSHYLNKVKWSDGSVDDSWKLRLQKDIRLYRNISLTYGRLSHDNLSSPPCFTNAYRRWANGRLDWLPSGPGMLDLIIQIQEPNPIHVAGGEDDTHDVGGRTPESWLTIGILVRAPTYTSSNSQRPVRNTPCEGKGCFTPSNSRPEPS